MVRMRAITLLLLSPAFPSGIIALLHLPCPLVAYPSRVSTAYALVGRRVGFIYRESEKGHSRKLVVAIPATNISFYGAQRSGTSGSCCVLPGHSHTCCEDLLRGATGCCSRVAGELVLCALSCVAQRTTQDKAHRTGRQGFSSNLPLPPAHRRRAE